MLVAGVFAVLVIWGVGDFVSERTYTGPVTVVNADRVCIGGLEASGQCFFKDAVTRGLRVDDCVRVTYAPGSKVQGPYTALQVIEVPASAHPVACPSH